MLTYLASSQFFSAFPISLSIFTNVNILFRMRNYDVIIIGGGASGLMAAGQAAQNGAKVLVLEKMNRPARKLRITGKGRCNITNNANLDEFLENMGPNPAFLRSAFAQFFSPELIEFMHKIGIRTVDERGGRVFSASGKAQDIVDALVDWLRNKNVEIQTDTSVSEILTIDKKVVGVKTSNGEAIFAKTLILATGGSSYPATGSTGDGYKLSKFVGHKINTVMPALVPLTTTNSYAPMLTGLKLKNIRINVFLNDKQTESVFGEMEFYEHGLTGPLIITLSRKYIENITNKDKLVFSFDLKPALDDNKLDARLVRDFNEFGKLKLHEILRKLIPIALIPACVSECKLSPMKTGNQISSEERGRIKNWLKDFRIEITGHRSFEEAIITKGGIDTNEIDSKNMESKLIQNLFLAGEVIDIDANTGGYNLQIAFSTGWLAGQAVLGKIG